MDYSGVKMRIDWHQLKVAVKSKALNNKRIDVEYN